MNACGPFIASDLEELHACLLTQADRVVPMRDIYKGDIGRRVIGMRHDVDDNKGSLDTALRMAEWEFDHGYSSTYFLLHDSYYWGEEAFVAAERLEDLGHEVGIHVNAIAEALRRDRDPRHILRDALTELRTAARVVGCVAHGDQLCGKARFVNDEMFLESPRPNWGGPTRYLMWRDVMVKLRPCSRGEFGLEYDASWLARGDYMSDSGHEWSQPFEQVCAVWPERGQLHLNIHPDWWANAFAEVVV